MLSCILGKFLGQLCTNSNGYFISNEEGTNILIFDKFIFPCKFLSERHLCLQHKNLDQNRHSNFPHVKEPLQQWLSNSFNRWAISLSNGLVLARSSSNLSLPCPPVANRLGLESQVAADILERLTLCLPLATQGNKAKPFSVCKLLSRHFLFCETQLTKLMPFVAWVGIQKGGNFTTRGPALRYQKFDRTRLEVRPHFVRIILRGFADNYPVSIFVLAAFCPHFVRIRAFLPS